MQIEVSKEMKTLLTTLAISAVLIAIGKLSGQIGVLGNMIILSVLIITIPQFFMVYMRYRDIREMEEQFPHFLRDLTENIASGMPLSKAITVASKIRYGALSKEIKKMANQISWGMSTEKVLDQFAERVKKSNRLFTATRIIRECYTSGGDIVSILDSVADSCVLLQESQKERKMILNQYTVIIYAVSIIFLIIIAALNRFLIPIFRMPIGEASMGLTNPCASCFGIACSFCGLNEAVAHNIFGVDPHSIGAYYLSLFFFIALVQSFFGGLIAGQIAEGSLTAGLKHSMILVVIVFGAFSIFVQLKLVGV